MARCAERSHGRQDSDRRSARVRLLNPPTLETTMQVVADRAEAPTAIHTDLRAIFVSLELSRSTWLITSLSPGGGEKMSKHSVQAGDIAGLLRRFVQLKEKARARTGRDFPIITIQEAGLDGFWIHRVLQSEGIESHVVDAASILTSRRRRRAKTDRIDGETLVRTLMAFKRGEPRVCCMARAPTPQEEDRRRVCRERKTLVGERVRHVNRIKGLLFAQGVFGYEPLRKGRRERLENLRTGDGRPLPVHLKAQIIRELDRLEVLLEQLKSVEAERDALLKPATEEAVSPSAMLTRLKGIVRPRAASGICPDPHLRILCGDAAGRRDRLCCSVSSRLSRSRPAPGPAACSASTPPSCAPASVSSTSRRTSPPTKGMADALRAARPALRARLDGDPVIHPALPRRGLRHRR